MASIDVTKRRMLQGMAAFTFIGSVPAKPALGREFGTTDFRNAEVACEIRDRATHLSFVTEPMANPEGRFGIHDGLLSCDPEGTPKPGLAKSWKVSADGRRYTFTLRDDVQWHDGVRFTSADVAKSVELLKAVHPRGRATFGEIDRIETPDERTAIFVLKAASPFLLHALTTSDAPIVPRHLFNDVKY